MMRMKLFIGKWFKSLLTWIFPVLSRALKYILTAG